MGRDPTRSYWWGVAFLAVWLVFSSIACGDGTLGLRQPETPTAVAAVVAESAPQPTAAKSETVASVREIVRPAGTSTIAEVVRKVRPAVVNITSEQIGYDMYLRPMPEVAGVGSGVIISSQGHILTNSHVVAGSQALKVSLPDGRSFDARLIGADPRTDLAVVRIEADDLPVAELGDSDQLEVGQWVVAIGNALALPGGPTVTAGVVGALGRSIQTNSGGVLYDLVQTDAAINPGNSGGPLLDLSGQVVGINTAIAQAPGAGIGFAISINRAKPIVAALIDRGYVSRPWLGVGLADVTPAIAARYGLPVQRGVIVTRVVPGSPAEQAGLERGDIIYAIDDSPIEDTVDLFKTMDRKRVGDTAKVSLVRPDGRIDLRVVLEEMPTE